MIDPGTGLTILGTAVGGSKLIEKILGPTSDYVGEQLKEWAVKKITNTANIFKNAEKKLGDKINEDGRVPPKVLKGIFEDGAWCEEELQVEYFGGVLASSRSGISRDDRGAYYTSLISRLSTYQLRSHYLFYHLFKNYFDGQAVNINDGSTWPGLRLLIPFETFYNAMDFAEDEEKNWTNILSHIIWGLSKEDLISNFSYGSLEHMQRQFAQAKEPGILVCPTKMGTELFMWAYGHGQLDSNDFFKNELKFQNEQNIQIGQAISTKKVIDEERQAKKEEKDRQKNNS